MTTFLYVDNICPHCHQQVRLTTVTSTNTLGGRETDFHTHAIGFSPLPLMMNTCLNCGYTASSCDFGEHVCLSEELKHKLCSEFSALVKQGVPDAWIRYEWAAKQALYQNRDPHRIGDLYLKAAWCAEDELERDAEIKYRLQAIKYFRKWLERGSEYGYKRLMTTYLIAESYRRAEDCFLAEKWFDRVIFEAEERADDEEFAEIAELARQQRDMPRKFLWEA